MILPHDAEGEVRRAAQRRILDGIADVVEGTAAALRARRRRVGPAPGCMVQARALDQRLVRFRETTAAGSLRS